MPVERAIGWALLLYGLAAQAFPLTEISCASCHPAQARSQPATSMGHALERASECAILRNNPKLTFTKGGYSYQIVRERDRSMYTVSNGKQMISTELPWAFGQGLAGQTYVYQLNGIWYESRVSYYQK